MIYDYFFPGSGVKYCDERVCLSVRTHISRTTPSNHQVFRSLLPVAARRLCRLLKTVEKISTVRPVL